MSQPPDRSDSEALYRLRERLDALDRQLLETAAQRLEAVREIRRLKTQLGQAPFDRTREKAVFDRARQTARALELDPSVAHALIYTLVEAAHHLQIPHSAGENGSAEDARRFLIVGGAGQMGRRLGHSLSARGHRVEVLEKDDDLDRPLAVGRADVTLLAVPMDRAVAVAAELAPLVRPDALLCDINSLKEEICAVMAERCEGEVLGLHPMFGPTVHSLRRQKVVVCPVRTGPLCEWMQGELARMGMELIVADPPSHDRMMAVVQVLVHFRTLVMGEALRRTGVTLEDSLRFTSPIYRLELAVVGRLFAQDPELYAEIEMSNPYAAEVRQHFLSAAESIEAVIAGGERQAFRAAFLQIGGYFREFSEEAMALSDFLIDAIVGRP